MRQRPSPPRGERGSAYIVVLLALVVLTIIGLSLVMVTQTEVQLDSNERTISRTFFAADSGISIAPARRLNEGADAAFTYIQNESSLGNERIADQVQLSRFVMLSSSLADGCTGNANEQTCYNTDNITSATASRVSWEGVGMPPVGAKVLSQSQVVSEVRILNEMFINIDTVR